MEHEQSITLRFLWKPTVRYRARKSPSIVSLLSQTDPVKIFPFCNLKSPLNIIHPSTFWFSRWSLTISFLYQKCVVFFRIDIFILILCLLHLCLNSTMYKYFRFCYLGKSSLL